MSGEQKFYLGLTFVIVTGIVTLILGCVHIARNNEVQMAQQGYHQTTLQGVQGTYWVK